MVGIALRPTKESSERLVNAHIELSETLTSDFVLGAEECIPHLSLVHVPGVGLSDELVFAFSKLGDLIAQVARREFGSRPFSLRANEIIYVPEGWLFLDLVNSDLLQSLHDESFTSMRPFFLGGSKPVSELAH